jgi:hypothetical protein
LSETLEPRLSASKIPSKTSLSVRITPMELLPLLLCLLRNLKVRQGRKTGMKDKHNSNRNHATYL